MLYSLSAIRRCILQEQQFDPIRGQCGSAWGGGTEYMAEKAVRFQLIRLGCFYDAVDYSTRFGPVGRVHEKKVLPTHYEWLDAA